MNYDFQFILLLLLISNDCPRHISLILLLVSFQFAVNVTVNRRSVAEFGENIFGEPIASSQRHAAADFRWER